MHKTYLKSIDPRVNKSRFYSLQIQPDMWGGVSLVREYGRIGSSGKIMTNWFESKSEAVKLLDLLHQQKLKRGYLALV